MDNTFNFECERGHRFTEYTKCRYVYCPECGTEIPRYDEDIYGRTKAQLIAEGHRDGVYMEDRDEAKRLKDLEILSNRSTDKMKARGVTIDTRCLDSTILSNTGAKSLIDLLERKPDGTHIIIMGQPQRGKTQYMKAAMDLISKNKIEFYDPYTPRFTAEELADCIQTTMEPFEYIVGVDWAEEYYNDDYVCRKCKRDFHDCICFDNPMDKRRFLRQLRRERK